MNTHASRRLVAAVAVATALALTACSSSGGKATAGAPGASASPSAAVEPTVPPGSPGLTGSLASSAPATAKPKPTPSVKQLIHYAVAATRTCSWNTMKDGHLQIVLGFKITATGKNPPTNVPFTVAVGTVTSTDYQPVGTAFEATLDSGQPLAGNAWLGKVITAKVTVNGGQPNAVHATLTLNGPVAKVANGNTYCPAA
jgi:hypothetical protein